MTGMIPTAGGAYLPASPIAAVTDEATGKITLSVGGKTINVGETGLRDISGTFATRTEGTISIQREGDLVTFSANVLKLSNSGTFTLPGAIPLGFRPDSVFNGFAVQLTGTDGWRVGIAVNGNFSLYAYTAEAWVRFTFIWTTADAWPTALPGV